MEVESHKLEKVIEEHLSELAPKYREVIILHYFEELSYDEIAECSMSLLGQWEYAYGGRARLSHSKKH